MTLANLVLDLRVRGSVPSPPPTYIDYVVFN